ncbi:MAG: M24 family metallopeptidase [Hyphomicrobiaceae bacterium]
MGEQAKRGFETTEYESRLVRAQEEMRARDLDAVVVTTPQNVRYFTGFATTFWESPTRPWFVILPREGQPIAVIPEIGAAGMAMTWVDDIRTWQAPRPEDDGLSLLASVFDALPVTTARIGWEMGRESVVRMPIADFDRLRGMMRGTEFVDASPLIWALRMIKSDGEISRIATACTIACDAFDALPEKLSAGQTEHGAAQAYRALLAEHGADSVPFLSVCSGEAGYSQIIVGPTERTLSAGDVLFVDVGATYDGYFSDFNRNFSFGPPEDAVRRAHETLWQATEAGIAAARPGATMEDLFHAMSGIIDAGGYAPPTTGRLGHGLGMHLTEPPSHMPGDRTVIAEGMVLTIEPGLEYVPGKMLVHEEDIAIRDGAAELLTRRSPQEMVVVG